MDGYRWLPPTLNLPWLNYLLVNAPDGYYEGFSWFDIYRDTEIGIKRSRGALFELIDDLKAKKFAVEQMMFFGFSQGCLMAMEVGLRYPAVFAGLVAISGWPHRPDRLVHELSPFARQQSFLVTHGTQDPLVPFNEAKKAFTMLKEAGVQIDWREFPKAHTIAGEEEIDIIRTFVCARYGRKAS